MKTVDELSIDELNELKDRYILDLEDNKIAFDEISLSDVKVHYEGAFFVDDDFFCNINKLK